MANRKPLLMNKELYNLLYDKTNKPKLKEIPEKIFNTLIGNINEKRNDTTGLKFMRHETFVVLSHFMPDTQNNNHKFWNDFYELRRDYKRNKESNKNKWFPKSKWRMQDYSVIKDFYSYLRLNFPNPIPYSLFIPYINCEEGYYSIGYVADKWLTDILSGESFYTRNKNYFTRTEVKYFLTCNWVDTYSLLFKYSSYRELLQHFWGAKIKANGLELSLDFFVNKFPNLTERRVQEFFRFICCNKKYVRDENEISDIWDFLSGREIDFNNITWQQLRHMSEDWHAQIYNHQLGSPMRIEEMKNKEWEKTTIKDFTHIIDEKMWTITEITTGKLLNEEGVDMHNCVFTYVNRCVSRYCAIFSVKVNDKRIATLEINLLNLELVQAKGKINTAITNDEIKSIIFIWVKENNIKLSDYAF
ncbi:MAG: PcfJ domain-containing protein [Treponema sp.]|jgi:hypothetical protein|nr:PcfJ domain-containing protein [Treponema sp.]